MPHVAFIEVFPENINASLITELESFLTCSQVTSISIAFLQETAIDNYFSANHSTATAWGQTAIFLPRKTAKVGGKGLEAKDFRLQGWKQRVESNGLEAKRLVSQAFGSRGALQVLPGSLRACRSAQSMPESCFCQQTIFGETHGLPEPTGPMEFP